jgi:hypothetical protein
MILFITTAVRTSIPTEQIFSPFVHFIEESALFYMNILLVTFVEDVHISLPTCPLFQYVNKTFIFEFYGVSV